MDLRITPQTRVNQALSFLDQQTATLANLQEQISSGSRLLRPSDDPLATVEVMASTAQDQRLGNYLTNIGTALASLNGSQSALSQVNNLLNQASQVAIQGANNTLGSTAFETLAQQVDTILGQVINLANSQQNGRYLFGGTATTTPPFVVSSTNGQGLPQTVSYVGATDNGQTTINQGQAVDTQYSGRQVFQSTPTDVFQALISLRDDLRNTAGLDSIAQAQALSQDVGNLNQARTGMELTVGKQAANQQSLTALQGQLQTLQLQAKQQTSNLQSADLPTVIVQLQAEQNTFQATLSTTARIFDQSLLDFLHP